MSKIIRAVLLGLAPVALLAPQAGAATSTSVGGCTVTPASPYVSGGYAYANAYVRCTTGRTVIVNHQIREDDVTSDDDVSVVRADAVTVPAGQTVRVGPVAGRCGNFDPTGAEELFHRARINVGGINSGWAESPRVSTTC